MARTMSVDLSMTMTAAVPSADFFSRQPSKSIEQRVGLVGSRRNHRHRRAAGNDGEQIVPAAAHAAGMPLDQLAQRNAHRLFDIAGPLDVAGDAIKLGAGIVRPADAGEPGGAAAHDVGHLRDGLDIVDRGRAAVEPHIGRERRLEPRHSLLAFEAFEQRRLLAADIGAGAVVDDDVEIEAVDVVLADQLRLIGLRRPPPAAARARG